MQVFDGHSGETAACFAEQHLLPNLLREESFLTAPAEALVRPHVIPKTAPGCHSCAFLTCGPLSIFATCTPYPAVHPDPMEVFQQQSALSCCHQCPMCSETPLP